MENEIIWTEDREYEGFKRIKFKDNTFNFVDTTGKILSENRFFFVYNFRDGFALVEFKNRNFNLINKDGKFLFKDNLLYSERNLDKINSIQFQDKTWNFIDTKGKLLLNENVKSIEFFKDSQIYEVKAENGNIFFVDSNLNIYTKYGVLN